MFQLSEVSVCGTSQQYQVSVISVYSTSQQCIRSRAGVRLSPMTREAPGGHHLLQPLRYHVERKLALLALLVRIPDLLCFLFSRTQRDRGASARPMGQRLGML